MTIGVAPMPRPAVQHVIERARERYGLTLDGPALHALHQALKAGRVRSQVVRVQPPRRRAGPGPTRPQEVRRVWIGKRPVLVVWDGARIVTFLPRQAWQGRG